MLESGHKSKTVSLPSGERQVWRQTPSTKLAETLLELTLSAARWVLGSHGAGCVRRAPRNPFTEVGSDVYRPLICCWVHGIPPVVNLQRIARLLHPQP